MSSMHGQWLVVKWAFKMSKASGGGIFSTHPSNEDRQKNLESLIPEAMKVYQAR